LSKQVNTLSHGLFFLGKTCNALFFDCGTFLLKNILESSNFSSTPSLFFNTYLARFFSNTPSLTLGSCFGLLTLTLHLFLITQNLTLSLPLVTQTLTLLRLFFDTKPFALLTRSHLLDTFRRLLIAGSSLVSDGCCVVEMILLVIGLFGLPISFAVLPSLFSHGSCISCAVSFFSIQDGVSVFLMVLC
jgi:hypothetical protein